MNDQTGAFAFSDSERERCIDIYAQLACCSSGAVQRYFYRQMVKLQLGRSAEQIERMEREKGLRQ